MWMERKREMAVDPSDFSFVLLGELNNGWVESAAERALEVRVLHNGNGRILVSAYVIRIRDGCNGADGLFLRRQWIVRYGVRIIDGERVPLAIPSNRDRALSGEHTTGEDDETNGSECQNSHDDP